MKSPKWVARTRQLIKSKHGFGWSISNWERNNKLITKVVYRYQNGSRNSILVDLNWSSDNSVKMMNLVVELAELMQERNVDFSKAYELINGGKISKGIKNEINWFALKEEFINEERGNRRDTTKRDLKKRLERTLQALNTKPLPRNAEQLFKNYADLFFDRTMPKGGVGRKRNMGDLRAFLNWAVWVSLGSKPEIIEKLSLQKVREKLSDRQELVLTFLEQRYEKNEGIFTTSQNLIENLKSEFNGDNTKSLSTLNQLENKKLIYSKPRNFDGKGKVLIFYPNKK